MRYKHIQSIRLTNHIFVFYKIFAVCLLCVFILLIFAPTNNNTNKGTKRGLPTFDRIYHTLFTYKGRQFSLFIQTNEQLY